MNEWQDEDRWALPPLPRMAWRRRFARLLYLAQFWTPRWSWECCYRPDRERGATRRQALRNWLEDGLRPYWNALGGR